VFYPSVCFSVCQARASITRKQSRLEKKTKNEANFLQSMINRCADSRYRSLTVNVIRRQKYRESDDMYFGQVFACGVRRSHSTLGLAKVIPRLLSAPAVLGNYIDRRIRVQNF